MPPALHRPTLESLELHVPPVEDHRDAHDLVLSLVTPRAGHGARYLDIGLFSDDGEVVVRAARATKQESPSDVAIGVVPRLGAWRRRAELVSFDLTLTAIAHLGGVSLARATGSIAALDQTITLDDRVVVIGERRKPRRPYAWARATLFGELDGQRIVCVVETARRRAGSVVLPELGRMRLFGPGARMLPRGCALTLPLRAEYGTGQLRAAALAPGHKLELAVDVPLDKTALFEVVDPNGDAAYSHRALGSVATLKIITRRKVARELVLHGRYEWGARAGDPRVEHRAWRA